MEILKGCAQAIAEYDLDVMLTGREAEIRRVAEENEISEQNGTRGYPDIITMEDHAGDIMKSKSQSSMVCSRSSPAGNGRRFTSAGNSGALVVGLTLIVKRIPRLSASGVRADHAGKTKAFFMLIDGGRTWSRSRKCSSNSV